MGAYAGAHQNPMMMGGGNGGNNRIAMMGANPLACSYNGGMMAMPNTMFVASPGGGNMIMMAPMYGIKQQQPYMMGAVPGVGVGGGGGGGVATGNTHGFMPLDKAFATDTKKQTPAVNGCNPMAMTMGHVPQNNFMQQLSMTTPKGNIFMQPPAPNMQQMAAQQQMQLQQQQQQQQNVSIPIPGLSQTQPGIKSGYAQSLNATIAAPPKTRAVPTLKTQEPTPHKDIIVMPNVAATMAATSPKSVNPGQGTPFTSPPSPPPPSTTIPTIPAIPAMPTTSPQAKQQIIALQMKPPQAQIPGQPTAATTPPTTIPTTTATVTPIQPLQRPKVINVPEEHNPDRVPFTDRTSTIGCLKSLDDASDLFEVARPNTLSAAMLAAGVPNSDSVASACETRAVTVHKYIQNDTRYTRLAAEDAAALLALIYSGGSGVAATPLGVLNEALCGVRTRASVEPAAGLIRLVLEAMRKIPRCSESPPVPLYAAARFPLQYTVGSTHTWPGIMVLTSDPNEAQRRAGTLGTVVCVNGFYSGYDITPFCFGDVSMGVRTMVLEMETQFHVDSIGTNPTMVNVTVTPRSSYVLEALFPVILVRISTNDSSDSNNSSNDGGDDNCAGRTRDPKAAGSVNLDAAAGTTHHNNSSNDNNNNNNNFCSRISHASNPPQSITEVLMSIPEAAQRMVRGQIPIVEHFAAYNPTSTCVLVRWVCYQEGTTFTLTKRKKGGFSKGKFEHVYSGKALCYQCEGLEPDTSYEFRLTAEYKGQAGKPLSADVRTLPAAAQDKAFTRSGWADCPRELAGGSAFAVSGSPVARNVVKRGGNMLCAAVGKVPLPHDAVSVWGIHIAASKKNDCSAIYVGVAPNDINLADSKNYLKNGWFIHCYNFNICSGPPQNIAFDHFGVEKRKGEYLKVGDVIVVVMDMRDGTLSFMVDGIQKVAFSNIPRNKSLVPIVTFFLDGDSFDLII